MAVMLVSLPPGAHKKQQRGSDGRLPDAELLEV
jgi:hypothetical protein